MITTHPTAFNNKTDPLLPIGSVKTVVQESQIISHGKCLIQTYAIRTTNLIIYPIGPQVPPAPLWRILNWYLSRFTSYNGLVSASDAELLVMVSTLREKWKFSVFMVSIYIYVTPSLDLTARIVVLSHLVRHPFIVH